MIAIIATSSRLYRGRDFVAELGRATRDRAALFFLGHDSTRNLRLVF